MYALKKAQPKDMRHAKNKNMLPTCSTTDCSNKAGFHFIDGKTWYSTTLILWYFNAHISLSVFSFCKYKSYSWQPRYTEIHTIIIVFFVDVLHGNKATHEFTWFTMLLMIMCIINRYTPDIDAFHHLILIIITHFILVRRFRRVLVIVVYRCRWYEIEDILSYVW